MRFISKHLYFKLKLIPCKHVKDNEKKIKQKEIMMSLKYIAQNTFHKTINLIESLWIQSHKVLKK